MTQGTLIVTPRAAESAFPVTGTLIRIKDAYGRVIAEDRIEKGSDGISREFLLPAPAAIHSFLPGDIRPYSLYGAEISNPSYYTANIEGIQIFDGETCRLPVEMLPLRDGGGSKSLTFTIPENGLRVKREFEREKPIDGRILTEVYIPQYITVHLGTPTSSARNVTVPFVDYIKNVASSEIYPTWPRESLRANILCQISLALNRIFTEWYTSRGYDFNITNSTAFDQYYVPNRNIFESISREVDEIFNIYIRKPGRKEPFFAEYCDGTSVTCAGLSQWGTVALANDGFSAEDILEFYYGDVDLVAAGDIRPIEGSYPGYPLSTGSSGEAVAIIQRQLNRIAQNYPDIPAVEADGVFGDSTRRAVQTFQRLFGLDQDGIVGKGTWYRISYIYAAVKKLAELTSEGEKPEYNRFQYPGYLLRYGSSGTDVQALQFYLQQISLFNPSVPRISADGKFGSATREAVRQFQSFYGLEVDGIVGNNTWNRVVEVYKGTRGVSPDVPVPGYDIKEYPGYIVRNGQRGENVLYIQNLLSAIRAVFRGIPEIARDGIFGNGTESAVIFFQKIFGLSPDGLVGMNTWNALNRIYIAVLDGKIPGATSPATRQYPGYLVRYGSSGEAVRYIQERLNTARYSVAELPRLTVDGIFGNGTKNAVLIFQKIFGLGQDGIVGKLTWEALSHIAAAVENGYLPAFSPRESDDPAGNCVAGTAEEDTAPVFSEIGNTAPPFPGTELKMGSFGEDVLLAKKALSAKKAYTAPVFGENYLFGQSMRKGVAAFQKSAGLPETGTLDRETWDKLFE